MTTVREAAKALAAKLRAIHDDPKYKAVWVTAQLHSGSYSGPQYGKELAALEKALEADAAAASQPETGAK